MHPRSSTFTTYLHNTSPKAFTTEKNRRHSNGSSPCRCGRHCRSRARDCHRRSFSGDSQGPGDLHFRRLDVGRREQQLPPPLPRQVRLPLVRDRLRGWLPHREVHQWQDHRRHHGCQVWRPAAAAVPLPVYDRRYGPRRRQLRVRWRRPSQRDRHLLRSVPLVRQPDIVLQADQERHDRQDRQEGRRGGGQWCNLPNRTWEQRLCQQLLAAVHGGRHHLHPRRVHRPPHGHHGSAAHEAVRSRGAQDLVHRARPTRLHPVAARPLRHRRVPGSCERVRRPVQRRGQGPAQRPERQAPRRAHVARRLLLHRHGPHRAPQEIRVQDVDHVVLRRGHVGGGPVPADRGALRRPHGVRVLGRVPHLRRGQPGHRRPPLRRHGERRRRAGQHQHHHLLASRRPITPRPAASPVCGWQRHHLRASRRPITPRRAASPACAWQHHHRRRASCRPITPRHAASPALTYRSSRWVHRSYRSSLHSQCQRIFVFHSSPLHQT